jgi:hypothetical protein
MARHHPEPRVVGHPWRTWEQLISADFERTLHSVYVRIQRARLSVSPQASLLLQHQTATKYLLVDPVVRALGWRREGSEKIHLDFKLEHRVKPFDYAMFVSAEPSVLLEVCPLGTELAGLGLASRVMRRAAESGFPWVVLTNGDEYRVHNAAAFGPGETEPFRTVRVTAAGSAVVWDTIGLLSPGELRRGAMGRAWELGRRDRLVRSAIEGMFAPNGIMAPLIADRVEGLTQEEIRESLSRLMVTAEFEPTTRPAKSTAPMAGRSKRMNGVELRIATWLQQSAMERWALGQRGAARRSRFRQRRARPSRRVAPDRRSLSPDRRRLAAEVAHERREGTERRTAERRTTADRRISADRRHATSVS